MWRLTTLALLLSLTVFGTEAFPPTWEDDEALRELYHQDLVAGDLHAAASKVFEWNRKEYLHITDEDPQARMKRFDCIHGMRNSLNVFQYLNRVGDSISKEMKEESIFAVSLGRFEAIYGMHIIRHGRGKEFEGFSKDYYEAYEETLEELKDMKTDIDTPYFIIDSEQDASRNPDKPGS